MKKTTLFVYLLLGVIYAKAQDSLPKQPADVDKVVFFNNSDYKMGRIPFGKPLEYTLSFTNKGKDTLVLQNVMVGCGCTTPKYKAGEKIAPGKSSVVVLGFNGDARGEFTRTADIIFTNGMVKQVRFSGTTYSDSTGTAVNR